MRPQNLVAEALVDAFWPHPDRGRTMSAPRPLLLALAPQPSRPATKPPVISPFSEDQALMERIAQGESQAFRSLSDQYLKAIVNFSYRIVQNHAEAEEIAQETFLRVWQKADTYQPKAKLSTWLFAIARNIAIDRTRKRGRKAEAFDLDDERDASPDSTGPSQLLAQKEAHLGLERVLAELPERQRSALALCHEEGLSNPAIAEVLGISVEAVESLLARGRRTLRQLLNQSQAPAISR